LCQVDSEGLFPSSSNAGLIVASKRPTENDDCKINGELKQNTKSDFNQAIDQPKLRPWPEPAIEAYMVLLSFLPFICCHFSAKVKVHL
jgi:hypothetical protein